MILTERLYFTEDRKAIVREGDLRAAFLVGGPGAVVPDKLAPLIEKLSATAVVQPESGHHSTPPVLVRDPEIVTRDPEVEGLQKRRGRPPKQR